MFEVERMEDECRLVMPEAMTIYQAGELFAALQPWLSEEQLLTVDLSAVTEMDTSGAQLLMLARKEREVNGLRFSLVRHSDAVLSVFERLGLSAWFHDPMVLTSSGKSS